MPARVKRIEHISVGVPTIGREQLRECIDSIMSGAAVPGQLVVIDQSGAEWIRSFLQRTVGRRSDLVHIISERRGIGAARNSFVRSSDRPYIAMTDDDCVADRGWLLSIGRALKMNGGAVITGRVLQGDDTLKVSVKEDLERRTIRKPSLLGDQLFTGNMACARRVFDKVGPFNESELLRAAAEDGEWMYRAFERGIVLVYDPSITVTHCHAGSSAELLAVTRRYARGSGAFYGIHLRRHLTFMSARILVGIARAARQWILGLARRDRERAVRGLAALRELLAGIAAGWRESAHPPPRRS